MARIREYVKLVLTLYFEISHTVLFRVLSRHCPFCMHLTGWLHCLEELEGLVSCHGTRCDDTSREGGGATVVELHRAPKVQKQMIML